MAEELIGSYDIPGLGIIDLIYDEIGSNPYRMRHNGLLGMYNKSEEELKDQVLLQIQQLLAEKKVSLEKQLKPVESSLRAMDACG
jgi:hypothetical protein